LEYKILQLGRNLAAVCLNTLPLLPCRRK